ncbi:MAG TPA: Hsp20/alpha crystallin family protein [Sulfurimonas sp.]|nr:Hsp20/alpha crystallin family protein [Sulfurimonas sp.]
MLLTRLEPFAELQELESRFSNLILNTNPGEFHPAVNTHEGKFAYHIDIDLPGVKKEDIHISMDGKLLIIKGKRETKDEVKEDDYYSMESHFGAFQRSFSLPDDIDIENIHAQDHEGVLDIVIPKIHVNDEIKEIKVA